MLHRSEDLYNKFLCVLFVVFALSWLNMWTIHSSIPSNQSILDQYENEYVTPIIIENPPTRTRTQPFKDEGSQDQRQFGNSEVIISKKDETPLVPTTTGIDESSKDVIINDTPPRPHPHAGARYADGKWGYIADVTRVRNHYLETYSKKPLTYVPFVDDQEEIVCSVEPGSGKNGFETELGWKALLKVKVNGPKAIPDMSNNCTYFNGTNTMNILNKERTDCDLSKMKQKETKVKKTPGKLLCAVYTYEKNHELIKVSSETWAWRCDGFLPASTVTVDSPSEVGYSAVNLTHEGPEMYDNMWQKTRSILTYLHDNYIDEYEYFYLVGDDTFVIVENMKAFLDGFDIDHDQTPLFTARYLYGFQDKYLVLGGGGYVLNRHALKRFVKEGLGFKEHDVSQREDRFTALSLRKLGIVANHSVDARGEQRFHHMSHSDVAEASGGKYLEFLDGLYGHKEGTDQISSESVSFHHMRNNLWMKRIHAILYRSCPRGTVIGDALESFDSSLNI